MSNPFLTGALRAGEPASSGPQLFGARPANARTNADTGFASALERRLEPGNRPPERAQAAPPAERSAQRQQRADERDDPHRPIDQAAAPGERAEAAAPASGAGGAHEPPPSNEAERAASLAVLGAPLAGPHAGIAGADATEGEAAEEGVGKAPRRRGMAAPGTPEALGRGANARSGKGASAPEEGVDLKLSKPEPASANALASSAPLRPNARPAAAPPGEHAAPFSAPAPGVSTRAAEPAEYPVRTPAGQRAWAEDVGSKVMWMVGRNESKAELVLTPPHLGKLEVSINVNGDQTSAHFVAASAAARDALEQAMPRLRELLQQAGISLGEANVSTSGEQTPGEEAPHGRGAGARSRSLALADADSAAAVEMPGAWTRAGRGVVDTFA